jgi:hypothetical protein
MNPMNITIHPKDTLYSVPTGKENSPQKGRSRKKRKSVGKKKDNKDSNNGVEKKPAAAPRPQRTPSSPFASPRGPKEPTVSKEATISKSVVHPSDMSDDGVVCSPVACATPAPMTTVPVMGNKLCNERSFTPMTEKKRNLQRVPRKRRDQRD